ncbi:hypothetical protein FACS189485_17250 [Spirochaetia bacterium]|nr:hypothetical protein FACS189485_17250 [Spirochaetia bacterium]
MWNKKYLICIMLFYLILNGLSAQAPDIYQRLDIISDNNNNGFMRMQELTKISVNNTRVVESGWIDLRGNNAHEEYFAFYVDVTTKIVYLIIISTHRPRPGEILLFYAWPPDNGGPGIEFFKRNNKPQIMIYYDGGSGHYFDFCILEYDLQSSLTTLNKIYEKSLGYMGGYKFIDQKIILTGSGKNYVLNFNDGKYILIEYGN